MNESPRVLGNRYEVGDLLGRGGMAEVHLGRDLRLGRSVAIKLLRTDLARDATFQARFRREAQSAAALNHPAIVAVYDTGEEQIVESGGSIVSLPYIVMEHVEGQTLREILGDGHPLEVDTALRITAGVLQALEYSHRIGIVHRDIKPANVMLTPQDEIKVMDFGIARALADASSTMTQTQAVIGTAQYLSPEQARGESVDIRSDLYSTGCLLYELLTGRPPFVADSPVAVAYQHVREYAAPPSTYNPAIPEEVDRIVLHSLGKDRADRYQNAAEFRADIEAARAGRQVAAPMASVPADAGAATEIFGATRAMGPVAGAYGTGPLPTSGSPFDEYGQGGYDEPPKRNRTAAILGLIVVIALVLGGVAYAVSKLVDNGSGDVVQVAVPEVQGQTQAQVQTALTAANLTLTPQQEASDSVPAGQAIRANPASGTRVDENTAVTVFFSSGSGSIAVPEVNGLDQDDAEQAIEDAGLTVGDSTDRASDDVDKGKVIESNPRQGVKIDANEPVSLVISSGPGEVDVPTVEGLQYNEAKRQLENDGFKVVQEPVENDSTTPGIVLDQSPTGKVAPGSTITLTVAIAPTAQPTTSSPTVTESPTDDGDGDGEPDASGPTTQTP